VSVVDDGRLRVLKNRKGHHLHPSVVAFLPNGKVSVGVRGKLRKIIDPANTIFSIKRIIGQPFSRKKLQEVIALFPFDVYEGANEQALVKTRAGVIPALHISSYVLRHLRKMSQRSLGRPIDECVITVPANFTEGQRKATVAAARGAGMSVLRVLNEPTAAALAYGHGQGLDQTIAVFDFGGGTFDITLLKVRGDVFEVLATGGDSFLGGDDMDRALAEHLALEFLRQHRFDLRADRMSFAKLMVIAEEVKIRLSKQEVVEDVVRELAYGEGGAPLDLELSITRDKFNSLVSSIVERSLVHCESVLAQGGMLPSDVDAVVLAGGACRMPYVYQRVAELFDREPQAHIDPMQVVSAGAGIYAHHLRTADQNTGAGLLMDVTSHALGMATVGEETEHLIDKNVTIPAEGTRVFTTSKDNQTTVRIYVCQGESRSFRRNAPIGELRFDNLRPAPRGEVEIEVSFLIDSDGMLSVSARDLETGRETEATMSVLGIDETARTPEVWDAEPTVA
jgi:molecular chaperone DnaK